jgi:hypothetical protein
MSHVLMTLAEFFGERGAFLWLAIGFGTFFGAYGLFMVLTAQIRVGAGGPWGNRSPWAAKGFAIAELAFQFWFNFVGGFVGWVALAFLWSESFDAYGWKELLTVIIAFGGITGNLPHLSTAIREALVGLGKRLGGEK